MAPPVARFRESELRRFGERALESCGVPSPTAALVTESLLQADVRGVATHGIVRLASYCHEVRAGIVDGGAQPTVISDRGGAVAFVDGGHAFGAVTATFSLELAVGRALANGIGAVGARNCAHFGAAAHYALRGADRGCVAIVASNTPAVMAPYGGREAAIGNNPFAVAAPMPEGRPAFVLDMAQSVVARGRIKLAEMAGAAIPEGWAMDVEGRVTTDPTAALAGALLAFGGYKGSGLALVVEILTSVLAGSILGPEMLNTSMTGAVSRRPGATVGSPSQLFVALDPAAFAGRDAFADGIRRLANAIKEVGPAPGFDEVLLPGELEHRAAAESKRLGVPLAPSTVQLLSELAASSSLALPEPLAA
jgi:LDH2 family malate/lactate/ureidoglycolate dehydrogenase